MKVKKDLERAKDACYRLLKVRARSEKELSDRLRLKGFDNNIIQQAIVALSEAGLVDDEAFARMWVESRIHKPLGIHRLDSELKIKGVSKEIISQVLSEYNSPQREEEAIRYLLEKRIKKLKGLDKKKIKERLWAFFLHKGFSRETVFEVLNEL